MIDQAATASIVICCYLHERADDVRDAVRSALEQTIGVHEVLVIVDHNPSLQAELERTLPGAIVMANRQTKGLSGARNTGIAAATGSLLLFLDDDATADPDMLSAMQCRMAIDPANLGIVARIVPAWRGKAPAWFPAEFLWVVGCTYEGLVPGATRNLIGAAMMVRRSVFERVGGFESALGRLESGLPLGCEETELCIRAQKAHPEGGFVYLPDAVCTHKVAARRATWKYLIRRCYAEGLSKASLSRLVRSTAALSVERTYVLHVLPRGVLRGLAQALHGDASGLLRAVAIILGFSCTLGGYAIGRALIAWRATKSAAPSRPGALSPLPVERDP